MAAGRNGVKAIAESLQFFFKAGCLHNSGCPGTLYRVGWPWIYRDSSVSASQLLGLKVCTTMPGESLYLDQEA